MIIRMQPALYTALSRFTSGYENMLTEFSCCSYHFSDILSQYSTVFGGLGLKEKCLFLIGHITCLEMLIESRAEVDCRDKKVSGGYCTVGACT